MTQAAPSPAIECKRGFDPRPDIAKSAARVAVTALRNAMDEGTEWTFEAHSNSGSTQMLEEFARGESGYITLDLRTDTQMLHFYSAGGYGDIELAESTHDLYGHVTIDATLETGAKLDEWVQEEYSRLQREAVADLHGREGHC